MATLSEEEKKQLSPEQQERYCEWCWGKDYGNCDICALKKMNKNDSMPEK